MSPLSDLLVDYEQNQNPTGFFQERENKYLTSSHNAWMKKVYAVLPRQSEHRTYNPCHWLTDLHINGTAYFGEDMLSDPVR